MTTALEITYKKWTSEAGPRQTKDVEKALNKLRNAGSGVLVLTTSILDGSEGAHVRTCYGSTTPEEKAHEAKRIEACNVLNDKYSGTVTRDNCREIIAEALKACQPLIDCRPVRDERKTQEQHAAEKQQRIDAAQRQEKEREEREAKEAAARQELEQNADFAGLERRETTKKSDHALAAANIRRELRKAFPGHKFRVTSSSFSMGDSVHISWADGPNTREVEALTDKYQEGRFDGMEDYYKLKDDRTFNQTFGGAKYVQADRSISEDIRETVKQALIDSGRDSYEADRDLHRTLSSVSLYGKGAFKGLEIEAGQLVATFEDKPMAPTAAPSTLPGCEIQEHMHTKRGYMIYLVVLAQKVERFEFDELRNAAKAAGGWYSRAWGQTPGGFAFKTREEAEAFAASLSPQTPDGSGSGKQSPGNPDRAQKLRDMADKLGPTIDQKRAPMTQNATPKRTLQYKSRRIEGDRLERVQRALYVLADLVEAGTLPPLLSGCLSKSALFDMLHTKTDSSGGYYEIVDTGTYTDTSPAAVMVQELLQSSQTAEGSEEAEARKKAQTIEDKILDFVGCKIPGFFVTHKEAAQRVIYEADIRKGDTVLEPEAGTGNLADLAKEAGGVVTCVEMRPALVEILELKGYPTAEADFLEWCLCDQYNEETGETSRPQFDRIIMNPPFEKGQDMKHVIAAYELCLKEDGGRLVAIMSEGTFFRSDSQAEGFRRWLNAVGGTSEKLPEGSFAKAGEVNKTGTATRIVTIDK